MLGKAAASRYRSVLSVVAFMLAGAAAASDFPSKPIRAVVGFSPGGSSDVLTRLVGSAVGPILGQNVMVENRAGAAGLIAAAEVAKSAPDGHTVYQCPMSSVTIAPQLIGAKVPIDAGAEMTPIVNIALSSYAMVVPAGSRFKSVADVVAASRAEAGRITFASVGNGSAQHMSAELLKRMEKLDLVHVPYRGAAPAIVDLAAGRVDFMITNLGDVVQHISSGRLRLLGQGDPSIHPLYPEAPRIADAVRGFDVTGWFGLCGPKGMPEAAVRRWAKAMEQAMASPDLQRKLREAGLTPNFEGPEQFAARLKNDRERWLAVIQAGNVRAE